MADDPRVVAYFVRHEETALNSEKRFRGPLDPPLDEKGISGLDDTRDYFSNVELGSAFSSDKQRVEQTATGVLQPKGMTFQSDPALRAWNIGYLAGEKKSDHADDISYFQRHPDVQIPSGESLNQFRDRIRPAILRSLQAGVSSDKPSITFLHSSGVKEVSNVIHGDHNKVQVKPGGIAAVTYDGSNFNMKAVLRPKTGAAKKDGYGQ